MSTQEYQIDFITRVFYKKAKDMGYYNDADIMRVQNDIADDIILDNMPINTPMPQFSSYLDKINYIVACGYDIN